MSKFWSYLKTRQFRVNLLLAAATLVVFVMIVIFGLNIYTRHGTGIPVPQLKGMQIEKAMSLLKDQGFEFKIDSVYVLDQTPGAVIEQDPDAGTNVKENRTIYLTVVTRLAPPISMPDLEPYTYREAAATLANFGLKVGDTIYKADIARDRVLEMRFGGQPIKAGTKIPKGSRIDLVLGNGEGAAEVEIPDLMNKDFDEAKFVIRNSGLTLGTITYQGPITDSTSLVVVAQTPMRVDSTSKASNGTRINLTVSQGKKDATLNQ
ncbi:MAG: PASTA domain-containing protein [Mucilaginibacter sp.]|uniref:PASTA domain-containing protein n=1 Tax=Mucilaginibacter sp. L3T2-6 TaxID=3062491 RepID=UPI0026772C52|nr:PASTA domain-containing protein [Mucilaginibacter sp. L3T2-6]MDO3641058.1 PASTA domain-containing protein [Mucilaginibacter sp. L3T2-6]MDV6213466.1 PASTA domain-containing protein [Mucilaginibacter sp. L3T2-6]